MHEYAQRLKTEELEWWQGIQESSCLPWGGKCRGGEIFKGSGDSWKETQGPLTSGLSNFLSSCDGGVGQSTQTTLFIICRVVSNL